jgi:hypothetical protein
MPTRLAPKLDDEVTEAVDNGGILAKARLAVDVADGADPLRYAIEISELAFEGSEDRKGSQARCSQDTLKDGRHHCSHQACVQWLNSYLTASEQARFVAQLTEHALARVAVHVNRR